MEKIRALLLLLFFVTGYFVVDLLSLWVDLFSISTGAGLLVLVGVFVFAFLLSLLAAKWLNRRAGYAARFQQRQAILDWACAAAVVGAFLSTLRHGIFEIVSLVITAAGLCVAWWTLLGAIPANGARSAPSPPAG